MSEGFIPAVYEPIILAALRRDSIVFDLFMEPRRQRDLIWSLGQRPCSSEHFDEWIAMGGWCPECKAVL